MRIDLIFDFRRCLLGSRGVGKSGSRGVGESGSREVGESGSNPEPNPPPAPPTPLRRGAGGELRDETQQQSIAPFTALFS